MEQILIDLQNHKWQEEATNRTIEFTPFKHSYQPDAFCFRAYDQYGVYTSSGLEYYHILRDNEGRMFLNVNGGQNRYFAIERPLNEIVLVLTPLSGGDPEKHTGTPVI